MGADDNELAWRARKAADSSITYPDILYHLHHPMSRIKMGDYYENNCRIRAFIHKHSAQICTFFKENKEKLGNRDHPWRMDTDEFFDVVSLQEPMEGFQGTAVRDMPEPPVTWFDQEQYRIKWETHKEHEG